MDLGQTAVLMPNTLQNRAHGVWYTELTPEGRAQRNQGNTFKNLKGGIKTMDQSAIQQAMQLGQQIGQGGVNTFDNLLATLSSGGNAEGDMTRLQDVQALGGGLEQAFSQFLQASHNGMATGESFLHLLPWFKAQAQQGGLSTQGGTSSTAFPTASESLAAQEAQAQVGRTGDMSSRFSTAAFSGSGA